MKITQKEDIFNAKIYEKLLSQQQIKTDLVGEDCKLPIDQKQLTEAINLALNSNYKEHVYIAHNQNNYIKATVAALLTTCQKPAILPPKADIALVYNFKNSANPLALVFQRGRARNFKQELELWPKLIKKQLKDLRLQKEYYDLQTELLLAVECYEREAVNNLANAALANSLHLIYDKADDEEQWSFELQINYKKKLLSYEQFKQKIYAENLPKLVSEKVIKTYFESYHQLTLLQQTIEEKLLVAHKTLEDYLFVALKPLLLKEVRRLTEVYSASGLEDYLLLLIANFRENLKIFDEYNEHKVAVKSADEGEGDLFASAEVRKILECYQLNILYEAEEDFMVVEEPQPSFSRLFGSVESKDDNYSFMHLRAGSLLKAQHGVLILNLAELIAYEEESFEKLKHILLNEVLEIERYAPSQSSSSMLFHSTPIPIQTTVILLGSIALYEQLCEQDRTFAKLFPWLGEVKDRIKATEANCLAYQQFFYNYSQKNQLKPLTSEAWLFFLNYIMQRSETYGYLSYDLEFFSQFLQSANYHSAQVAELTPAILKATIAAKQNLYGYEEELWFEDVQNGYLKIVASGVAIGKVNALVYIERGDYNYGYPIVVTALASKGTGQIVSIEREIGLSGEIHDKGIFTLESFIRGWLGSKKALNLRISLSFEQNYDGVDGDSATLAETCAILSALSQIPLKQSIAITGSMNQFGEVQAVGGISEKIGGFFKFCQLGGLTGTQGVVMPKANKNQLFLSDEFWQAVATGQFHLWAVDTIDEALELVMHAPQGHKKVKYGFLKKRIKKIMKINL